jgi:chromosome segregation ATPase
MIDWKAWLDKSGLVLGIAEAAREHIVEGINKELAHELELARDRLNAAAEELGNYQRDLREARADLEMAQREVTRLKMQVATQPVGAKE